MTPLPNWDDFEALLRAHPWPTWHQIDEKPTRYTCHEDEIYCLDGSSTFALLYILRPARVRPHGAFESIIFLKGHRAFAQILERLPEMLMEQAL